MKPKAIIIILTVLLALSFFLDDAIIDSMDHVRNDVFDSFFSWATNFGNVIVIFIIVTTLFMWRERKQEYILPLWLSFILSIAISYIFKFIVSRQRLIPTFIPFFGLYDYSFPSTHATVIFTSLPIIAKEYPKIKWFWLVLGIFVVTGRVYFHIHYFSDIVAGALLGYLIGHFILEYEEKKGIFRKAGWKDDNST